MFRRVRRPALLLAAAGATLVLAAPAGGDEGSGKAMLKSDLVASRTTSLPVPGFPSLAPGGRNWVIDEEHSRAVVREDGRIRVDIEGLLFETAPFLPLPTVSASVGCGGMLTSSDVQVQLSDEGDARIEDELMLPDPCMDPIVFVHPRLNRGTWIARTTG
jgi:hypothetical protein